MDLDLIDLKAPNKDEEQTFCAYGNHVNPYIQDLKSLSEDTFMTNFSSNGAYDQIADPPNKDALDDHPIDVSAKIKNPKAVLDALKSSTTQISNNVSMHANNDEDAPITYDAYVKLSDIEEYFTVENKAVYIEILT
ncbi:hypothetical protein RclHR1_12260007 [Rhizophagus clarus]|uniref:Uncharacterized protein n=1 Tax=Rhizophagus clarus TaxID=94130 RepID=A0A2Z6Q6Q3_9GLOM|nr:hypothetical protein RclHR1_12260007 [Rhizophagus clarus]